jgi:hypothetical protein
VHQAWTSLSSAPALPSHIAVLPAASAGEKVAAKELQRVLRKVRPKRSFATGPPLRNGSQFLVGAAAAAEQGVPASRWRELGAEGFVVDSTTPTVLLSGRPGSARGSTYAVSHLLFALGVRHLAADETVLPKACPDSLPRLDVAHNPSFEYRDNDQLQVRDNPRWAVGVGYNGASLNASRAQGGSVRYATPPGFVHTSYALLSFPAEPHVVKNGEGKDTRVHPPALFAKHPEWFWPRSSGATGQLCWSNASLVAFAAAQALRVLAADPHAEILSVSQEDNGERCQSAEEERVNEEEGSPMGALLRAVGRERLEPASLPPLAPVRAGPPLLPRSASLHLRAFLCSQVNQVAAAVRKKHPRVAVSTLAYQWSRAPPQKTRPAANVVVQLCTIECDFAHGMRHPHNAAFVKDLAGWSAISGRLYIWDYITDFANYLMPFPNWCRPRRPREPARPSPRSARARASYRVRAAQGTGSGRRSSSSPSTTCRASSPRASTTARGPATSPS